MEMGVKRGFCCIFMLLWYHKKGVMTMVEKDDWRLTAGPVCGHEERLKNIPLYYIPFQPLSRQWDHEHCAFCWDKFYLHEECLQEGYCTRPQNEPGAYWICPACYEDFKELFGWTAGGEMPENGSVSSL